MLFISIINIAVAFFRYISLCVKLGLSFLFMFLPIFLAEIGFNFLYEFLPIFLSGVGPNSKFLSIFSLKIGLNPLHEFSSIFFIFKKLLLMLVFISKYCLLLAKSWLLFGFLFFLVLPLNQGFLQLVLVLLQIKIILKT